LSFTSRQKSNNVAKVVLILVLIIIAGIGGFIGFSPMFEKNAPKITVEKNIYWNLKNPIDVVIEDESNIKAYTVTFIDGNKRMPLAVNETKIGNQVQLSIVPPKFPRRYTPSTTSIEIKVTDDSKWNFFAGNEASTTANVIIDTINPTANVIANSYMLKQGGSATLVVEVKDDNLKDAYVSFNNQEFFELIPFHKENYYMAIIAWPIDIDEFKRVDLVASDMANNVSVTKIPYYIKSHKTKIDKINVSSRFINNVSKAVLQKSGYQVPSDDVEAFVLSNKDLRKDNVETIKNVVRQYMNKDQVSTFGLKTFKQLRNGKTFALYGERRHYFYDNNKIDEAWHLGIDWASIKKAKIYTTNAGKVIFNDYLGIYGNTIILDHKFGLATLYGHTTNSHVMLDDYVNDNDLIANTGSTGAVFGDHLHFGVLVQGIEVNPLEWLDSNWIKLNVKNILNNAKKVIDSK